MAPNRRLSVGGQLAMQLFPDNSGSLCNAAGDMRIIAANCATGIAVQSLTGNVGMGGCIAPAFGLDVSGTVRASTFIGSGTTQWSTNASNVYIAGSNVGIGSSVPAYPLDVSGTVRASTFIGSGAGLTGLTGVNVVGGSQWTTNNSANVYIAGSNVGIGRSVPDYPLDVSGTVRATAFIGSGTTQWTTNASNLYIAGSNVGIGSSTPAYQLDVSGTVRATAFIGSGTSQWTTNAATVYIANSIVGIGSSVPAYPLDVSGTVRATTFIGSGAGLTGLSGVNVVGGSQWTTNAYNVYIAGGSNVGIGMSTPAYPLDISGTVRATAFVGSGAGLTGLAVPSPWTTITSNAVIAAGSNVGIGTNTPVAALHVVGNTLVTGDITAFYSDDRLKRRVGDIQDAIGLLNGLSTFRYAPNETAMQAGFPDKIGLGLSAQEVRAVLPEIVGQAPFDVSDTAMGSKSGMNYLTIQYERMVPVLVQAVRELNQEVKQLRRDEHNWRLLTLCVPILSAIFIYSLFPVFASTSSGVSSYKYTA